MNRIHIGISGWRYAGWRGVFYPPGLVQAHELAFASRAVKRPMRHPIEIRHASFCVPAFVKLLRKYRAALVVSDR